MIPAQWVPSFVMNCWHEPYILSLWTEEKGGSPGRGLYDERSKVIYHFQIYNTDSILAMQCSWTLMSIRMEWIILSTEVNLCLLGKRLASYKFCLGSTCITMKLINEVVNGGVTIILFGVTNAVCVPKKRNLSIFRGFKRARKHIRTLEWKSKRDGIPLERVRSLAQEEGVDPYHLDLVLLPLFFLIPSRVLFLPISNRTCRAKSSSCKTCLI